MEKHKQLSERAKRRIDAQQLCNFTALDKRTKHELMMKRRRRMCICTRGMWQMAKSQTCVSGRDNKSGSVSRAAACPPCLAGLLGRVWVEYGRTRHTRHTRHTWFGAALHTLGTLFTLSCYLHRQLPTLGTLYKDRDVVNMDEGAFKSLVQQDRCLPSMPIWSLGQGKVQAAQELRS